MIDFIEHKQPHNDSQLLELDSLALAAASTNRHHNHQLSSAQQHQQQQPQQQLTMQTMYPALSQLGTLLVDGSQQASNSELIGYYFGSISRDTAEWILKTHGQYCDGAYLLRSSGPNDDFVLSLMVVPGGGGQQNIPQTATISRKHQQPPPNFEVLHYKIIETEDSFVALHGQLSDEKFPTIDELIDKAQGVATKPRFAVLRQSLEFEILPPTYWGLTMDQVRLAILLKARQWGFPLLSSLFQLQPAQAAGGAIEPVEQQQQQQLGDQSDQAVGLSQPTASTTTTTLSNETIRTLIYKSLHEFQPWFHGKISRDEAERRIEEAAKLSQRDGRFLVRERDNYSYAMCISHRKTTKHYRIDVLPTGELAIQDGRKFTSLMALVSHYTIMSDGLWCALTEPCARPIQQAADFGRMLAGLGGPAGQLQQQHQQQQLQQQSFYCVPPRQDQQQQLAISQGQPQREQQQQQQQQQGLTCGHQGGVAAIKVPIREWLQTINHKWIQPLISSNSNSARQAGQPAQRHTLNSFLFGNQNPLNNNCSSCRRQNFTSYARPSRHHNSTSGTRGGARKSSKQQQQQACMQHKRPASSNGPARAVQAASSSGGNNIDFMASDNNNNNRAALRQQQEQLACNPLKANRGEPNWPSKGRLSVATIGRDRPAAVAAAAVASDFLSYGQAYNSASAISYGQQQLSSAGFALNNHSIIGSPWFAVQQPAPHQQPRSCQNQKPATYLATGSDDNTPIGRQDGRLISPAQSINANLNTSNSNPYNLSSCVDNGSNIYGSASASATASSTVTITNGHKTAPTTTLSSSSSGGQSVTLPIGSVVARPPAYCSSGNNADCLDASGYQQRALLNATTMLNTTATTTTTRASAASSDLMSATRTSALPVGPILCGKHAAGAYRYSNGNGLDDGGCFANCAHHHHNQQQQRQKLANTLQRQQYQQQPVAGPTVAQNAHLPPDYFQDARNHLISTRAVDDSQLVALGQRPINPAAMSKFVQFQDGQCLRTHRDAKSIQMVYLSSRQAAASRASQMAPRPQLDAHNLRPQFVQTQHLEQQMRPPVVQQQHKLQQQQQQHQMAHQNQSQQQLAAEPPDLIDCNADYQPDDELDFEFRYDPKLIKSSSIETLCSIGIGHSNERKEGHDNEQEQEDFSSFRTNAELMLSLQSRWFNSNGQQHHQQQQQLEPDSILNPIPTMQCDLLNGNVGSSSKQLESGSCQASNGLLGCHSNQDSGSSVEQVASRLLAGSGQQQQQQLQQQFDESARKRHDLDELTTALLAELTASLKAQAELKNRQAGLFMSSVANDMDTNSNNNNHNGQHQQPADDYAYEDSGQQTTIGELLANNCQQLELINEFDTLLQNGKANCNASIGRQ